jgi:hypothetical protein
MDLGIRKDNSDRSWREIGSGFAAGAAAGMGIEAAVLE